MPIAAYDNPPANPAEPDTAVPKRRGFIALTLAEIRRLLNAHNHNHDESAAITHALRWSAWRREHQTQARRYHFQRRLRLQTLTI